MRTFIVILLFIYVALAKLPLPKTKEDFENLDIKGYITTLSDQEKSEIYKLHSKLDAHFRGVDHQDLYIHTLTEDVTCNKTQLCDQYDICVEICAPGSVQVDPWLTNSMKTQRKLLNNQPINYVYLPGSHNSAIAKAHGYGLEENYLTSLVQSLDSSWVVYIANQQFALTDQLNMGVRHIELDIHWYDDEIRICHAGGAHLQYLDDLVAFLSKIFDVPIDWDSETLGCFFPNYRTLNQTLQEILDWQQQGDNAEFFLIFMFDDEQDLQAWNKVDLIVEGVNYYFADVIFTPNDKEKFFPASWPTVSQLFSMGKNMIFASRIDYGPRMAPYIFARDTLWTEYDPDDLLPFPACVLVPSNVTVNTGKMIRAMGDSLIYGPFYNGTNGGLFVPETSEIYAGCNGNFPCVDQESPILAQGSVWTWDEGEPSQNGTICVAIGTNGRWRALECSETLPYACQSTENQNQWVLYEQGPWEKAACPSGYEFGVPTTGYMSNVIKSLGKEAWINYNSST